MGMAVFAGMLAATIIGVLLIPAFFVMIEGRKKKEPKDTIQPGTTKEHLA